ncbi:MAG: Hsp20/alpha crystallin family protein [Burkholderiaceae bacterium]
MIGSYRAAGSLFPELTWLQQQLEGMLQPSGVSGIRAVALGAFPAVNVGNTADAIEVIAFAPGIDPQEIEITVDRGLLTLSGQRNGDSSQPRGDMNAYAQERFAGPFRRVISLPADADPTKVDAKFRDGILQVTVAKRESSKPRQISVN